MPRVKYFTLICLLKSSLQSKNVTVIILTFQKWPHAHIDRREAYESIRTCPTPSREQCSSGSSYGNSLTGSAFPINSCVWNFNRGAGEE